MRLIVEETGHINKSEDNSPYLCPINHVLGRARYRLVGMISEVGHGCAPSHQSLLSTPVPGLSPFAWALDRNLQGQVVKQRNKGRGQWGHAGPMIYGLSVPAPFWGTCTCIAQVLLNRNTCSFTSEMCKRVGKWPLFFEVISNMYVAFSK